MTPDALPADDLPTRKYHLQVVIDTSEAEAAVAELADRARTSPPATRIEWVLWWIVVVGCGALIIASALTGNPLAAAGWAVASWHTQALGPRWSHR